MLGWYWAAEFGKISGQIERQRNLVDGDLSTKEGDI
jgi:hypothetical protein